MTWRAAAFGLLVWLVAAEAHADRATAIAAYAQGDYAAALAELFPLAVAGDAEAQFLLGTMYDHGLGVQQDPVSAANWYRAAAAQGNVAAAAALEGLQDAAAAQAPAPAATGADFDAAMASYRSGDFARAHALLSALADDTSYAGLSGAAAVQRRAEVQYWLGLLYDKGQGVGEDPAEAAQWYREAAQSGNPDAAYNLAVLYEQGRGVSVDLNEAYTWYSAAQARGHPQAHAAIEKLLYRREGGDVGGTDFGAAVAAFERWDYAWAADILRPLAEQGQVEAQLYLAHILDTHLTDGDPQEIRRWLRAAAEQGDSTAQLVLARSYANMFRGLPADHAEAVRWYRAAAEQGSPDAQMALGMAYNEGKGVPMDAAEADRWYKTSHRTRAGVDLLLRSECAAAAGTTALAPVYEACNRGDGQAAWKALFALAKQGEPAAQAWLAFVYYAGSQITVGLDEVPPFAATHDYFSRGARWYRAAVEQGDAAAQYNLGVVSEFGMGVAADLEEATRWYEAAAEQGNAPAAAALYLLRDAPSGEDDRLDALLSAVRSGAFELPMGDLATLAFEGDAEAQMLEGCLYLTGRYGRPDIATARRDFQAAADQGHDAAEELLELLE